MKSTAYRREMTNWVTLQTDKLSKLLMRLVRRFDIPMFACLSINCFTYRLLSQAHRLDLELVMIFTSSCRAYIFFSETQRYDVWRIRLILFSSLFDYEDQCFSWLGFFCYFRDNNNADNCQLTKADGCFDRNRGVRSWNSGIKQNVIYSPAHNPLVLFPCS